MIRTTVDMMEVTRLTREGRLGDAMAALRGLSPRPPATEEDRSAGAAERPGRTAPMVPAPSEALLPHLPAGEPSGIAAQVPSPKLLRGLFSRIGLRQPVHGLDGLLGRPTIREPAPLPAGARFEQRIYGNAAGTRSYKLYVPSRYSGKALPLLVMLHGCTQSPDDFAAGTRMNDLAEEHLFLVAYPAQAQSANPSKCWNWFSSADQIRDQGEPSLIAGITREIMREFPIATERVYVAGLSAGGAAAAVMGSTYPDLYAAVGVHSGLACGAARDMPSAFAAMKQGGSPALRGGPQVPTIVFHGDRDTAVNPINADQVISQARAARALHSSVSQGTSPGGLRYRRTLHESADGKPVLEQWVIYGAGHAWAGGSPTGSYTDARGPDASREMVRFFLSTAGTNGSTN